MCGVVYAVKFTLKIELGLSEGLVLFVAVISRTANNDQVLYYLSDVY